MNSKGFTLVELIVVIAILAVASGLIATNFFGLIGKKDTFQDEVIAKGIAEAAYVYYDSNDNLAPYKVEANKGCYNAKILVDNGYIAPDQGLLDKCDAKCVGDNYRFKIIISGDGEKSVNVYRNGDDSCANGNKIDY